MKNPLTCRTSEGVRDVSYGTYPVKPFRLLGSRKMGGDNLDPLRPRYFLPIR